MMPGEMKKTSISTLNLIKIAGPESDEIEMMEDDDEVSVEDMEYFNSIIIYQILFGVSGALIGDSCWVHRQSHQALFWAI